MVATVVGADQQGQASGDKSTQEQAEEQSPYMRARSAKGKAEEKTPKPPRTYTNEDLKRLFGAPTEPEAEPTEAPAAGDAGKPAEGAPPDATLDPLGALEKQKADASDQAKRVAAAQKELEAAKKKLADLEVQELAVRNPFSARPKLSEEEQEKRAAGGETATERLERTQKLVEEAKKEVAAAEAKLAEAQAGP